MGIVCMIIFINWIQTNISSVILWIFVVIQPRQYGHYLLAWRIYKCPFSQSNNYYEEREILHPSLARKYSNCWWNVGVISQNSYWNPAVSKSSWSSHTFLNIVEIIYTYLLNLSSKQILLFWFCLNFTKSWNASGSITLVKLIWRLEPKILN